MISDGRLSNPDKGNFIRCSITLKKDIAVIINSKNSRSKFSPSNSLRQKKHDGENRQRFLRVQCNPRSRFNVPSSAVSLPSIALISNMAEDESYDSLKNGEKGHKKLKPVKSASGTS